MKCLKFSLNLPIKVAASVSYAIFLGSVWQWRIVLLLILLSIFVTILPCLPIIHEIKS